MGRPFSLPCGWIYTSKKEEQVFKEILITLERKKSLSTSALAKEIKRDPSVTGYHAWKLACKRLLRVRQFGRNRIWDLSTKYKTILKNSKKDSHTKEL